MDLREYQKKIVHDCRVAYSQGARAPLVVLPTGGGKTFVFCYIARSAASKGGRVLILVHRRELVAQTSRSLAALGVSHGVIAAGHPMRLQEAVQVASIETVRRRSALPWSPTLVVVDEAHHSVARTWSEVIGRWAGARVLGVTATPVRQDGAGLSDIYDAMVTGPSMAELIEQGHLCEMTIYAPPAQVSTDGVRSRGGDYARGESARAAKRISGDVVGYYRRLLDGRSAIAFCCHVEHAEHIAERMRGAGYRAHAVHGGTPPAERDALIAGLGDGSVQVLCSCDIISEGTDVPSVTGALLLRPTQSLGLYLQQVGRVLRPAAGKDRAIIIDHAGNVARHGLPDDDRTWSLDGGCVDARAADDAEPGPWTCDECWEMGAPPRPRVCPSCEAEMTQTELPEEDASEELVEIDPEEMRRARRREEAGARTLEELQEIARRRGYKPGWAHHRYRARMARR